MRADVVPTELVFLGIGSPLDREVAAGTVALRFPLRLVLRFLALP